ncbi:MAG: alpha/beta hydrolase [Actinomycetota bacterium]
MALAVVGAVGAVLAVMVGTVSPAAGQVTVEVNRAVQYGEGSGAPLLLDAYVPAAEGTDRRPAVVLVHGGGGREVFDREARLIAAKGWVAFTIDYRPGAVAAVEDMSVAVTWVRANADRYRVEPGRIAALGESFGGYLVGMAAVVGRGDRSEGSRVRAAVSWSGPMDLAALAREQGEAAVAPMVGCRLADCPDLYADLSPITHVDPTDAPLYMISGTGEPVIRAQATAMATRIEDVGGRTQLQAVEGSRTALEYREDVWAPTELFLERQLVPQPATSIGTLVFALTMALVAAGAVYGLRRRAGSRT